MRTHCSDKTIRLTALRWRGAGVGVWRWCRAGDGLLQFATVAVGYMMIELRSVLVPLALSIALFMFLLPVVDGLNAR
eukprot:COSAG01_NODE_1445_length_10281_cov_33.445099_13_plen_77_part_00